MSVYHKLLVAIREHGRAVRDEYHGMLFAFEDVNYYDMNVSGSDTVTQGMNFRVIAEIEGFSDAGGYVILKPVSLIAR